MKDELYFTSGLFISDYYNIEGTHLELIEYAEPFLQNINCI